MIYFYRHSIAQCRKAFSLMELLVVIGLVVIVTAIGVAGLQMTIRQSKNAQCISNLKQIGHGTNIYLVEHRNRFYPEARAGKAVEDSYGYWLLAVRKSLDIPVTELPGAVPQGDVLKTFVCPAHPTKGGWQKHGAPAGKGIAGNESTVGFLAHSYVPNRYVLNIPITEIVERSKVILFADFPWEALGTRSYWRGDNWSNNLPLDWHNGMVNCLFADFHVEAVPAKSLRLWARNDRLWYPNYPDLPWAK